MLTSILPGYIKASRGGLRRAKWPLRYFPCIGHKRHVGQRYISILPNIERAGKKR